MFRRVDTSLTDIEEFIARNDTFFVFLRSFELDGEQLVLPENLGIALFLRALLGLPLIGLFLFSDALQIGATVVFLVAGALFIVSSIFWRSRTLDDRIRKDLRKLGPIVCLSAKPSPNNSLPIKSSDSDWETTVEQLVESSRAIFVLPSHSEGLLTELSIVDRCGRLEDTVFLMPPRRIIDPDFPYEEEWMRLQRAVADMGFAWPHYQEQGMLFRLSKRGSIAILASVFDDSFNYQSFLVS